MGCGWQEQVGSRWVQKKEWKWGLEVGSGLRTGRGRTLSTLNSQGHLPSDRSPETHQWSLPRPDSGPFSATQATPLVSLCLTRDHHCPRPEDVDHWASSTPTCPFCPLQWIPATYSALLGPSHPQLPLTASWMTLTRMHPDRQPGQME